MAYPFRPGVRGDDFIYKQQLGKDTLSHFKFTQVSILPLFQQAIEMTERMSNAEENCLELGYIAQDLAKVDITQALEVVESVKSRWAKNNTLSNIAVDAVEADIERALEIAERIEDAWQKNETFMKIAVKLAKLDIKRALEVAEKADGWTTDSALEIALQVANVDKSRAINMFERLLAWAEETENKEERAEEFLNIGRKLARVDSKRAIKVLEQALELTESGTYGDYAEKNPVGDSVAIGEGERAALKWVSFFGYTEGRLSTMSEIAIELAKLNAGRALRVAEEIEDTIFPHKGYALSHIVVELAKVNINEAMELAKQIKNAYWRARAFLEIAKVLWDKASDINNSPVLSPIH